MKEQTARSTVNESTNKNEKTAGHSVEVSLHMRAQEESKIRST